MAVEPSYSALHPVNRVPCFCDGDVHSFAANFRRSDDVYYCSAVCDDDVCYDLFTFVYIFYYFWREVEEKRREEKRT